MNLLVELFYLLIQIVNNFNALRLKVSSRRGAKGAKSVISYAVRHCGVRSALRSACGSRASPADVAPPGETQGGGA